MQRLANRLRLLLPLLPFVCASGGGVFGEPLRADATAVPGEPATACHLSRFRQQVYAAFVSGNMDAWRTTIEDMEEQTPGDPEELLELINFQYGYIGWCLGQDRRREVQVVLSRLEENLERLKSASGETADYHAYAAAAYGFRIGLSAWRAPALGPRSMKHAEKALQVDGASFQANLEMGNLWRYRPAVFGGSKAKALPFYVKALAILEQEPSERRCRNWMYLKLLVLVGQLQQDLGNPEQARRCFEQALQIEPRFVWAKEALASPARR